ncbi:hypothetical protein WDZ17_09645 [Pseudokineococcus basanitobsidens]|uniref:Secreted protein n=1 Tax=Pseudokineococcus basanitobsidens TaxID=1926649 RepID=A0ABU8RKL0_9ACTN
MGQGSLALVGAVITAAAAVVGVVVAQLATARRERHQRAYAREREALLDVQDAALVVRSALRATGGAIEAAALAATPSSHVVLRTPGDAEAVQAEADGRLDVRLARVATTDVVAAVRAWQRSARYAFLGDEDVTTRDEQQAWSAMNLAVARALDDRSPRERRRGRTATSADGAVPQG